MQFSSKIKTNYLIGNVNKIYKYLLTFNLPKMRNNAKKASLI